MEESSGRGVSSDPEGHEVPAQLTVSEKTVIGRGSEKGRMKVARKGSLG